VRTVDLDELLRAQAGVLTAAQARAAGTSAATVARRVREGRWQRLHPGVFLVGSHRYSPEARVRAAWLWRGGLVAGASAAWCHGFLARAPETVDLSVPHTRSSGPGVRVRRRIVPVEDRTTLHGLAVTGPARTVLETATTLPEGSRFLDRALQKHVPFPQVRAAYSRMIGAHGSAEAGRLLTAAADRAHSKAERVLLSILRGAGITGWVLHLDSVGWEIDVAFPAERVAIEFDGWAWHSDVERFRNDRRKGNALLAAGWAVLRFTWHDLDRDPGRVVRDVTAALSRRRAS
jgi:very-short-patch-repair endonuclease